MFQIIASPSARSRQLWRRTENFLETFLQFRVYDLGFNATGLTTSLIELWTLAKHDDNDKDNIQNNNDSNNNNNGDNDDDIDYDNDYDSDNNDDDNDDSVNDEKHTNKNIERHTADTIVSWPNPKQWVIVQTSDLMMIIRQSMYIISIITREMGKLKTYSPTYCKMDNGENMLNLTHTLDKIYLTGIL